MTVTISHTAFPAIVDKIMHYADFETQLAFRGTSSQFKATIDKIYFKHALLCTDGFLGYDLQFPTMPTYPDWEAEDHFPAQPIEVVDVVTDVETMGRINVLYTAKSLHTIRRLGFKSTLTQFVLSGSLRTVVDFIHFFTDDTPIAPHISVCSTQERHIIHFRYDRRNMPVCAPTVLFDIRCARVNLAEMVIALWPDAEDGSLVSDEDSLEWESDALDPGRQMDKLRFPPALLLIIIQLAPFLVLGRKLKIVGMEKLGDAGRSFRGAFIAMIEINPEVSDSAEKIVRATTIITFDQWWAELGDKVQVEGLWNPLSQVDVCFNADRRTHSG